MHGELKIISGSASPSLAEAICEHLGTKPSPVLRERFSDGEIRIEIGENVRGDDVFIVQPTCSPVNYHLMELCLMLDALKRASASRVTAVVPYFGYARQDRKVVPRAPISAKLVADLLSTAGMQRLVTCDLHAGQIQGFFNCPVDNLFAAPVLLEQLRERGRRLRDHLAGRGRRGARPCLRQTAGRNPGHRGQAARRAQPGQGHAHHRRRQGQGSRGRRRHDRHRRHHVCGGPTCSWTTGPRGVLACATHPVLSGPAIKRLEESAFSEIIVTDTIPLNDDKCCAKIKQCSVASLLAKAINNVHTESSVSVLFV